VRASLAQLARTCRAVSCVVVRRVSGALLRLLFRRRFLADFLYQRFPCYFNTREPDTVIIAAVAYPNGVFWNLIEARTGIVHYTSEGPGNDPYPPLTVRTATLYVAGCASIAEAAPRSGHEPLRINRC
jgi:hypothetical protein